MTRTEEVLDVWNDDLLKRKSYADFLTNYLVSRMSIGDEGPYRSLTLALDAQWGQGKTFFIERWAKHLEASDPSYPTLVFDSWKSDFATDPVVAFMSAFKEAIEVKIKEVGGEPEFSEQASSKVKNAVQGIRKAIMPASKEIAKGLLRKVTGIAVDDVFEAYQTGKIGEEVIANDDFGKAGLEAVNKGLDVFFSKALDDHSERQKAIGDFKKEISETLEALAGKEKLNLPMFVFIDELDRCRPDFALALLEGVKHLFDIPGVCFVISTNMTQLSEAVKAVYGSGFDGRGYLKRLFDAEYAIPLARGKDYLSAILKEHPILSSRSVLGLPPPDNSHQTAADVFDWIARAFALDLRAQRKVIETTSSAATGITKDKKVFLLWLAALSAIRHKDPEVFEKLATEHLDSGKFVLLWRSTAVSDKATEIEIIEPYGQQREKICFSLEHAAWYYYDTSWKDLKVINEENSREQRHRYPECLIMDIANEMPSTYYPRKKYSPSIASYFDLVRHAGYFASE